MDKIKLAESIDYLRKVMADNDLKIAELILQKNSKTPTLHQMFPFLKTK